MLILALDTCLSRCAVCLFDSAASRVLAQEHQDMQRGHAEALAPMVQQVLSTAGKRAKDLKRIAVTTGPGTFTGLRIGLSFARAFGLARGIPIVGLDTMQALRLSQGNKLIAVISGNSGYAFVLRAGETQTELVPVDELQATDFVTATPDLKLLAAWVAKQPTPLRMPEPVYIRGADAKPQVVVKEVGAESSELLSTLHHASFSQGWSAPDISSMFEIKGTRSFIAEIANEAAGFALIRSIADQTELLIIATLPSRRKMNVATQLLKKSFAAAQHADAEKIFLEVAHSNQSAQKLYIKLGFTEIGRRKSYYADGDDAVLMARSLA